jgi:hypothetical protein
VKKAPAQKEVVQVEETKEVSTSPKKPCEDLDSAVSGEVTTSAKSQSTPEKAQEAAATAVLKSRAEGGSGVKSLKNDKWWLKGVKGGELTQIEVDEEPLIFM